MSECKHEPGYYHAPEDTFAAAIEGMSHTVYRCKHCGKYVYMPSRRNAEWTLAPDSVQDVAGVAV